ncbi:MAG: HDOD domain-containing protein [Desulfobulbaceae bacterium]|nr:HDOD domain-containing protein [Desulfobulbaceae bacterium]
MLRKLVNAGDYLFESSARHTIFEAHLQTCVGVAIYDKLAGVGGLCHILLPDPAVPGSSWQPKSYASSCLALFVDDLLRAGASLNRLEAVMAGGSLSQPFSRHDMNLDIGGRTAECVSFFLKRHHIPIFRSETGGVSGMTIRLDTTNWQVGISQLVAAGGEEKTISKPSPDEIRQAINNAKPIPQITLKIIRLMQSGSYHMATIAEELSRDQVLSAKVISFCNSAHISSNAKIDSIERATLILGETKILEVVISASMKGLFEQQEGGYSLLRGGLFKHSVAVAGLARIIAEYSGKADAPTAYTAGLLHDIGKVVLDQYVTAARPLFYNIDQQKTKDLINVEKEAFAIDHQEIARELAVMWKLPDNLTECVSLHHYPERASEHPELVHIVYVADLLAFWFMAGIELEKVNTQMLTGRLRHLGLDADDIPEIVSKAPWDKLMYL